jgi:hypothetical protein
METAVSSAGLAYPRSERSESEREVRTVTAVIDVDVTAETAALIIAAPPLACTVRKRGCRWSTTPADFFTVFGIS